MDNKKRENTRLLYLERYLNKPPLDFILETTKKLHLPVLLVE